MRRTLQICWSRPRLHGFTSMKCWDEKNIMLCLHRSRQLILWRKQCSSSGILSVQSRQKRRGSALRQLFRCCLLCYGLTWALTPLLLSKMSVNNSTILLQMYGLSWALAPLLFCCSLAWALASLLFCYGWPWALAPQLWSQMSVFQLSISFIVT